VPIRLDDRNWLAALLDEELSAYDPAAARARLPADAVAAASIPGDLAHAARILVARTLRRPLTSGAKPPALFLEEVRRLLGIGLDLALLHGEPFVRARRRAELAAILAAGTGEDDLALAVAPHEPGGYSAAAVERALRTAGRVLRTRFYPPAEPPGGLPIRPGALSVLRRRLARAASSFHRDGRLVPEALLRHAAHAARESALLAEALSGLLRAAGTPTSRAAALRVRQVSHLGLPREEARTARRGVASPRPGDVLAAAAPASMRPFLLEQLRLAQLRRGFAGEAPTAYVDAFTRGAGLDPALVRAAHLEAAAQFEGTEDAPVLAEGEGRGWQVVAEEWEAATDQVVEKVSTVVAENLEALVTEIRQTGELGQLVAKAAAGHVLDDTERRKVKEQLVDLAKAVPALAIFAAPGGAILLPLLAKLLPFNLLPSAWDRAGGAGAAEPRPAPPPAGEEGGTPAPAPSTAGGGEEPASPDSLPDTRRRA
jgi:hypothetical protein